MGILVEVEPLRRPAGGLRDAVPAVILGVHSVWWQRRLDASFQECWGENCSLSHLPGNRFKWLHGEEGATHPETSRPLWGLLSFPVWLHRNSANVIFSCWFSRSAACASFDLSLSPFRWAQLRRKLILRTAGSWKNPDMLILGQGVLMKEGGHVGLDWHVLNNSALTDVELMFYCSCCT